MFMSISFLVAIAITQVALRDTMPDSLRNMLASRKSIQHARIDWSIANTFDRYTLGLPTHYRSLLAGSDMGVISEGDDFGVSAFNESGDPIPRMRTAEMRNESGTWTLQTDLFFGKLVRTDATPQPMQDVRAVGLLPTPVTFIALDELLAKYPDTAGTTCFSERRVNGMFEVEGSTVSQRLKIRWTIDPKKDWSPVRVQLIKDQLVLNDCETDYEYVNGIWFPKAARYYGMDGSLVTEIRVNDAKIEGVDLPRELSAEHIGFCTGVQVTAFDREDDDESQSDYYFVEGRDLVLAPDFLRMIKQNEVHPDLRCIEFVERMRNRDPEATAKPMPTLNSRIAFNPSTRPATLRQGRVRHRSDDLWERYVAAFIRHFSLDAEQTQKAQLILRECVDRREPLLRDRRRELASMLDRAMATESVDRTVSELLARFLEPIDRIFEEQLKPRLDRLPSRAQIAAAGPFAFPDRAVPASRPGN